MNMQGLSGKNMDHLYIETERLIINEFDESMAQAVHENSLDDDNRRFVPDEVFETVETAYETVRFLIECYNGDSGPYVYPVLLRSGENIGHVQAVPLDRDEWEIGYHIAKSYTGNGYATEAIAAFLPVVMERLGICKIEGFCLLENVASQRVMEKCGFALEYNGIGSYQGKEREICRYIYYSNGGTSHG